MSIYDIWDSILAFFGIKKSITTDKQQAENSSYTTKYEDTSERNFTAVISNRVATLALSDSNVNIPEDNKRAKLLNDIMKKVWNKMQKNASLALVICTPKVRHFWRCIFLWVKQEEKTKNIVQNLKYLL